MKRRVPQLRWPLRRLACLLIAVLPLLAAVSPTRADMAAPMAAPVAASAASSVSDPPADQSGSAAGPSATAPTGAASAVSPAPAHVPPPALSGDEARTVLDVLNDPAKRAAFSATLSAIVKAQPAAAPAAPAATTPAHEHTGNGAAAAPAAPAATPAAPAHEAEEHPTHTTVEGLKIPLAPDSLGAQVLVTASDFVNRGGTEAMNAIRTVQSVPLLWGWIVVMVTSPWARDLLMDVAWRLAIAFAAAVAVEYVLRRLMHRPMLFLETIAPNGARHDRHDGTHDDLAEHDVAEAHTATADAGDATVQPNGDGVAAKPVARAAEAAGNTSAPAGSKLPPHEDDPLARAEAGDTEAPPHKKRRRPSAWTLLRRLPLVLARLVLDLIPVIALAVTGHLIAGSSIGGQTVSRLVILAVIDAYTISAALLCVARMLLSPDAPRLRLFHLTDSAARNLMAWIQRLVLIAIFGYAIGEVGLLLGMSDTAHEAVQKATGLLLHVCLIVIVIRQRRRVRKWLQAPEGATGVASLIRNRLAAIWHWIALFFLIAGWLVYAVEVPHGYTQLMRFFGLTAMVLILARLLMLLMLGFIDRALHIGPSTAERFPGIEGRLRVYHPAIAALVRGIIFLLVALSLLQVYGLGTLSWLVTSMLGRRIISAILTLSVTVLLALAVWEGVNAAIQSHLAKLQREAQIARSARLRTLLPLLRSALLITIIVIAGLMILSEIGVNIAPLLAGAGIIGVAIGFGSQKLVQDLITGIFLLLENAMQVGDWVTVSGLSGTVEALSVRTIRLRASDGSVHIIPFSAVTSVTNINRGLGNASVSVVVDFAEDTDHVAAVLKEIVAGMRTETEFSSKMLSDLQLWGVDKVDGGCVTIAGQVVCTDSGRWAVQREFNRRMKKRFQELGIRMFNPLRTITVAETLPPALGPAQEAASHGTV
jgi:moderate conductance mechanosensitive channel